jgi:bacterioferritin
VSGENAELIRILNQALSAEYGTLFLLPRHMAAVPDEETRRQLRLIADVELEHAEKTAQMIVALGGEPTGDLPNLQPRSGVREILEAHVQGEREAIATYQQAIAACSDPELRKQLEGLKTDEEGHQRLLERALARLGG